MPSKGEQLRKWINAPDILVMPGVFNGYSMRMVAKAGYPAAFISGGGVAENLLGWPDVGLMGLEDNLRVARALADCADLPLIADADTGYGNATNVRFTLRAFEQAGVAGVMIEDQVWPKRCGHLKGKEVIRAEEMAAKVRSAAEARRDPQTVIMARTDSAATHGLDDAIARLNQYADAGADLLFADALTSVESIAQAARSVRAPLAVNMGFGIRRRSTTPLLSARQLQELGVAVVIYPRLLTAAAVRGMMNALHALEQSLESGEVVDRPELMVSFEELNDLVGLAEIDDLERRYRVE